MTYLLDSQQKVWILFKFGFRQKSQILDFLRHSLATNLMSGDAPVSDISDILGHTSTLTTEIYLTIDEKHLKEVSLEVPNA